MSGHKKKKKRPVKLGRATTVFPALGPLFGVLFLGNLSVRAWRMSVFFLSGHKKKQKKAVQTGTRDGLFWRTRPIFVCLGFTTTFGCFLYKNEPARPSFLRLGRCLGFFSLGSCAWGLGAWSRGASFCRATKRRKKRPFKQRRATASSGAQGRFLYAWGLLQPLDAFYTKMNPLGRLSCAWAAVWGSFLWGDVEHWGSGLGQGGLLFVGPQKEEKKGRSNRNARQPILAHRADFCMPGVYYNL